MDSTVTSRSLQDAIETVVKEEPMDRYSPSNMSTDDENNSSENVAELDAVIVEKKDETGSNNSQSDNERSNTSSKASNISSKKGPVVGNKDIQTEKSTCNRILKRKKRKFDWEVIIVNEDLANVESGEDKIDRKTCKHKLTLSNFPTHWGESELKEFILKLVCIYYCFVFLDLFYLYAENT